MNVKFDREAIYGDNEQYIKTKIKSCGGKINKYFQVKEVPKENASYKCLSLIMSDSVIRVNKKCCPQTLLEDRKYETKKNKIENLIINDDLEPSLSESDNESDREYIKDESDSIDC